MKKILLILLTLLFVPIVYADMGAPMIKEYDVTVFSQNGAPLYNGEIDDDYGLTYEKTNLKIAPGELFTIYDGDVDLAEYLDFMYLDEGEEYVNVISDNEYNEEVEDTYKTGYVSKKDLTAVQDSYKFVEKEWGKAEKIYILQDQDIRVGVGYSFKSTGKVLKAGTAIKARPSTIESNLWLYVEYNGTKGYICGTNGAVGYSLIEKATLRTNTDAEVHGLSQFRGKVLDTIKADQTKVVKLYTLDAWSQGYYIEYDNIKGYINNIEAVMKDNKVNVVLQDDRPLYKNFNIDENDENAEYEIVKTIKAGTKFTTEYYTGRNYIYVYYEDGNTKGWFSSAYDLEDDKNGNITKLILFDDTDDYTVDDEEETPDVIEPNPDDVTTPTDPGTNPESIPNGPVKTILNNPLYSCLIIGVALVVGALVIIEYVNKKKKSEKND